MFLRKDQAGSAPGHTWEKPGDVVEVDDELAYQLLAIPYGGFSESEPPEPESDPEPDPDGEDDAPKRKGGRPRLPRDSEGKIIREVSESDTDAE